MRATDYWRPGPSADSHVGSRLLNTSQVSSARAPGPRDQSSWHPDSIGSSRLLALLAPTSIRVSALLTLVAFLAACGMERPNRVIEPDAVGLVSFTDYRDDGAVIVVELDGETIEFDHTEAIAFAARGVAPDGVLLFGEDGGRTWYASVGLAQTTGCYVIAPDAAFDEPNAIILVFVEWRDVGLRLPKREGFTVPPGVLVDSGRYIERSVFCVDAEGQVSIPIEG